MVNKRIMTAVVGMPLLIAAVWAGRNLFMLVVAVAAGIGTLEYSRLAEKMGATPILPLAVVFGAGLPLVYAYGGRPLIAEWLVALVAALMIVKIIAFRDFTWRDLAGTIWAVLYVGVLLNFMAFLYDLGNGPTFVIFTFVATWLADTSAYAIGGAIGRAKLAPSISPNKTIEGALGSMAVTSLAFAGFVFMPALSIGQRFIFGAALAAAAVGGDLFESLLKRRARVKDSGNLLPGHGGFLDRIDSLLFAAPVSFWLLRFWFGG